MNIDESVALVHRDLQAHNPLVHCITNYVSMDIAANMLNAAGASPAMVHDTHEAGEFASIASGIMINIGTPSPPWVDGMRAAVRAAADREIAWVLDPVAVGATTYRQGIVAELLEHRPAVIRGNASEIVTIATAVTSGRGVDSDTGIDQAVSAAGDLARRTGATVAITGSSDVVTDGEHVLCVEGGDPAMPLITALGCSVSAVTAACCAVSDDPVHASAAALAMFAVAGQRAGADSAGPGTLRWRLIDEIAKLTADDLAGRVTRR